MTCQKLQNRMQQREHNKENRKSEWISYLCIVWVTTRPDGGLHVSGAARIYMSPVTMMMKMGFLCGLSSATLQSTLGHGNLLWCLSVWMAEQQVNAAHMEKAAARVLIIKEALRLSSCIVPSHDGHKRVDYPFRRRLGKIIICCPLIQRPSHKSLLSSKLHHCSQAMAASSENSAMHWDSWW